MNKGFYGIPKSNKFEAPISASYALTASYVANVATINPSNRYIPYNNAGTFADTNISQQSGYINIGTNTQNVLGYDGYVRIWDGNYQPTNLQAPFGNFMINQNSIYNSGDGKIRYATNGYSQRIQMEPSIGQMVFTMGSSGIAGNVLTERIAMAIQNNGYVGIGKQYPSSSLDVSGSVKISNELLVDETLTKFAKYTNVGVGVANNVTLFSIATGSYTSAFGKYTIYSGSNSRAGELMTSRNGTAINHTDVATNDIGSTSGVILTSQVSQSYYQIIASFPATGTWDIKMMATYI